MTFDDYQQQACQTAMDKYDHDPLMQKTIWALGIAGEAGEVVEKWKKILMYKDGKISDEDRAELAKELGDVIWYIAVLADSLGLSLDEIIRQNIAKLQDRQERDVITGEGDER